MSVHIKALVHVIKKNVIHSLFTDSISINFSIGKDLLIGSASVLNIYEKDVR